MPATDRSFYLSAQFPNFIGDQTVACLVFCDCFSTSKIRIRLIASTWHKSSHAIRLGSRRKREKRGKEKLEINPLFGRGNRYLEPFSSSSLFFFSFSFSLSPSPYETVDTKPSGTKVEARGSIDRSIDRSLRDTKKPKLRGPYSRMGIAIRRKAYARRAC